MTTVELASWVPLLRVPEGYKTNGWYLRTIGDSQRLGLIIECEYKGQALTSHPSIRLSDKADEEQLHALVERAISKAEQEIKYAKQAVDEKRK